MDTPVKQWMTGSPVSIGADASALEALEAMIEHGIRHLPVVDTSRRVVGIVSIDDLRAGLPLEVSLRRPPSPEERLLARDVQVGDVMTYAPEVVRRDIALDEAAQRMADRRIGCLPVVDAEGRLEGILSETDVLHAVATRLWTDRVRARGGADDERAALIDELRRERERIRKEMTSTARDAETLITESRLGGLDEEERAADRTEARLADSIRELAYRRLEALDRALGRAEHGEIDRCERCEGRIPLARLRAMPGTTLCVACARGAGL